MNYFDTERPPDLTRLPNEVLVQRELRFRGFDMRLNEAWYHEPNLERRDKLFRTAQLCRHEYHRCVSESYRRLRIAQQVQVDAVAQQSA